MAPALATQCVAFCRCAERIDSLVGGGHDSRPPGAVSVSVPRRRTYLSSSTSVTQRNTATPSVAAVVDVDVGTAPVIPTLLGTFPPHPRSPQQPHPSAQAQPSTERESDVRSTCSSCPLLLSHHTSDGFKEYLRHTTVPNMTNIRKHQIKFNVAQNVHIKSYVSSVNSFQGFQHFPILEQCWKASGFIAFAIILTVFNTFKPSSL